MSTVIKFRAELKSHPEYPNAAYVIFPHDIKETFGKGRIKVKAQFDGEKYRGSLVKMSGIPLIIVKKEIREKIGKKHGEMIDVIIEEDLEPRLVTIPKELEWEFEQNPDVRAQFEKMSYTHRKEYAQYVGEAKKRETRMRRAEKVIQTINDVLSN